MEGKIYFRSRSGIQSLKHVAYTSDEIGVKYHQQLLGTRHLAIKKNAKLQRENQRYNKDCQSDVQTLYEICMALIVNNLDHVDSFYGLPSLIGEQIFDEALESDRFTNKEFDVTKLRLSIFMDAYGNEMFQRLNLSGQTMFIAQHIDEISLFLPYLHSVRLSNCGIGDSHEILFELGKLPQLECLCLDRNVIGDIGINNLLQLRRRNQQGLNNLQYLNLSDNKRISASSLFNLGLLPSLEALLISSSVKTVKTSKFGKFSMRCKNGANHIKGLNLNKFGNKNIEGWGCKLFDKWLSNFDIAEEERLVKMKKMKENFSGFYKTIKTNNCPLQHSVQTTSVMNDREPSILLCLCEYRSSPRPLITKKRKFVIEDIASINLAKSKRAKFEEFDKHLSNTPTEDQDLLKLYG